jgi:hypothetical protein
MEQQQERLEKIDIGEFCKKNCLAILFRKLQWLLYFILPLQEVVWTDYIFIV